jgi:hypothetical protein
MTTTSSRRERSLLSTSSILILSALLVGVSSIGVGGREFAPYVLICGMAGFIAFLGLELSGDRRRIEALEQEQRNIESRLDRHVRPSSNPVFTLPPRPEPHVPPVPAPEPCLAAAGIRAD